MTVKQAIFWRDSVLALKSKKLPVTSYQNRQFWQALKVLTTSKRYRENPGESCFNEGLTIIYRRVLRIYAQKQGPHRCDAECKEKNHCYFHDFKPGAVMYGLPNGDILIRSKK